MSKNFKPKYKLGAYVLRDDNTVGQVTGIHINQYNKTPVHNSDSIQYEFEGEDDWVDQDDICYELVKKVDKK